MNDNIYNSNIRDHLFWISLFLYTDPGGIFWGYYGSVIIEGQIAFRDLFFIIMAIMYVITKNNYNYKANKYIKQFTIAIILYLIYYTMIYGLINNTSSDFLFFFIKQRNSYMMIAVMYFIIKFISRNDKLFIKYLTIFSVIIFILYFFTLITGIELLPLRLSTRDYSNTTRYLMYSFSYFPLLIPISIIIIMFQVKIKSKKTIYFLASLMIVIWVLSSLRSEMINVIIYIIILYIITVKYKMIIISKVIKIIIIVLISILIVFIIFPDYLETTKQGFIEIYSIIKSGTTTYGKVDERLSLTKRTFIIEQFKNNKILGTGYNHLWYSQEGERLGYESTDYPFLGFVAQFGILGVLLFMPIYFIMFKIIKHILNEIPKKFISYGEIIQLLFVSVFLLHLISYPQWFFPGTLHYNNLFLYSLLAMAMGLTSMNNNHNPKIINV